MYSISDLSRITGVLAHTIRIWEKRYDILNPERTPGGHRLYNDDDIIKLMNIRRLVDRGYRISKLAALDPVEFNNELRLLETDFDSEDMQAVNDQLITAAFSFDEPAFWQTLARLEASHTTDEIWTKYLAPLMVKIGQLWLTKDIVPAQEHFVSHLIRRWIEYRIHISTDLSTEASKSILLYLPTNEYHELSLLMSYYNLRQAGWKVYYLGASLPNDHILNLSLKVDLVMAYVTLSSSVQSMYDFVMMNNISFDMWIAGGILKDYSFLEWPNNVSLIEFKEELVTKMENY